MKKFIAMLGFLVLGLTSFVSADEKASEVTYEVAMTGVT